MTQHDVRMWAYMYIADNELKDNDLLTYPLADGSVGIIYFPEVRGNHEDNKSIYLPFVKDNIRLQLMSIDDYRSVVRY